MKKIITNTRLHLVTLAVSLLITTTVLGLSAFLHDDADFSTTFTVVSKDVFKINITGQRHDNEVIFAGSSLDNSPTITHTGDAYPAYVFAMVDIDTNTFEPDDDGMNSDWTLLDGTENVWYYGTDEGLVPFTSSDSSTLFNSVIVRDDASTNNSAKIAVTVYAIQTMGYDASSPSDVWSDAYVN